MESLKFKVIDTVIPVDLEDTSGSTVRLKFELVYGWEVLQSMRKWLPSQETGTQQDIVETLKLYFPNQKEDVEKLAPYMQVAIFHKANSVIEEINREMDQKKTESLPPSSVSSSRRKESPSGAPPDSQGSRLTKTGRSSRARKNSSKLKEGGES